MADLVGTVEPGKLADLVVLDADPLTDISALREVHMVIKGGQRYLNRPT
jgi:imidazolonepropionase-like amidohydrolase